MTKGNLEVRVKLLEGVIMIGAIIAKRSVEGGIDALNRRDIPGFMGAWAEDAEWFYPGTLSVSGRFQGKPAVRGWFDHLMLQFPQLKFSLHSVSIAHLFDVVGENVAAAHWDISVTNRHGYTLGYSGVTMLTIRKGKVVSGSDYLFAANDEIRRGWGE